MDADPDDGRTETANQRADRNWSELLQELRVSQTGTQILTGFLLTIPFQQRFATLDTYERNLYLVLVLLAVLATALLLTPVPLHRVLFRRHLKPQLVEWGNRFARVGLFVLALVLAGGAMLLFDVVLGRTAGLLVGVSSLVVLLGFWWVLPQVIGRRTDRSATTQRPPGSRHTSR
ncbi:DUF6328 family protein [Cellulomonas sp. URHD0024]|uniref:DUF6328 family protein n=1 Tax=Cellulomonas sp. URHD0024 TaxID=1302620 RepID=UPI000687779A|nr:DUF6328 family protein [Cellulomonas sp. URHD0024]